MAKRVTKTKPAPIRQMLEGRAFAVNGVHLAPIAHRERVSLRAEAKSISALSGTLNLLLPKRPKESFTRTGRSALWLGPDEWLLIGKTDTAMADALAKSRVLHSAVSISHRNTAISVIGARAAEVLNSGCPQDLSLKSFPVGACSRTLMGKAEIVLWRTGKESFEIEVWRSFADYVWTFLVDAAKTV